uniref:Uncharacterized protein n=1 Tax=Oryza punctata TaxID=4537 RepID=A0A0E0LJ75_ORYPU
MAMTDNKWHASTGMRRRASLAAALSLQHRMLAAKMRLIIRMASVASSDEGGDGGGGEAGGEVEGGYGEPPVIGAAEEEGVHLGSHDVVGLGGGGPLRCWSPVSPAATKPRHSFPIAMASTKHGRREEGRGDDRRRVGGHGQGMVWMVGREGKKMVGPRMASC